MSKVNEYGVGLVEDLNNEKIDVLGAGHNSSFIYISERK